MGIRNSLARAAIVMLCASLGSHANAAEWSVYRSCVVSESGRFIAASRVDGAVELHDAESRQSRLLEAGSQAHFRSLAFAPDESMLIAADHHGMIVRWDTGSEFELTLRQAHVLRGALERADFDVVDSKKRERSLSWYHPPRIIVSPDSSRIFVAWGDGRRQLYARSGALIAEYEDIVREPEQTEAGWRDLDPEWDALDVEWGPGSHDMLLRLGGVVGVFDTRTGEPRRLGGESLTFPTSGDPHTCALSPDRTRLAIGYGNMQIGLFDYATGEELLHYQYTDDFFLAETAVVHQLAFSPSGDRLAFTSAGGAYVGVLDSTTFEEIYDSDFRGGHFGEVLRLIWLGDGDALAYWFDCGGGVELLDLRSKPRRLGIEGLVFPSLRTHTVVAVSAQSGALVQHSVDELFEQGKFIPETE